MNKQQEWLLFGTQDETRQHNKQQLELVCQKVFGECGPSINASKEHGILGRHAISDVHFQAI